MNGSEAPCQRKVDDAMKPEHSLCQENRLAKEKKLIIDTRPEWTLVTLGRDFRVTACIIDGAILVTRSCGFSNSYDINRYRQFIKNVMVEGLDSSRPYIHVMEWSELKGGSIGARNAMMKFIQDQSLLQAVLVCSASAFLRMTIRLTKKLYAFSRPIKFCPNLDFGIRMAGKLLHIKLPEYYTLPSALRESSIPISNIALQKAAGGQDSDALCHYALGDAHTLRIHRLGTGILYCQIHGMTALRSFDLSAVHKGRQRAVQRCLHNQPVHVEIWDCTNFQVLFRGPMLRKFFKTLFNTSLPLLGCIVMDSGYRTSATVQWCLMGNRPRYPVLNLASLTVAILKAQELLHEAGDAVQPEAPRIHALPEWQSVDDGCRIRNEIIDDDIIHTHVEGVLQDRHIQPALGIQRQLAGNAASLGRPYYVIVGVAELRGATFRARKTFIKSTLKLFRNIPFRMYLFYGAKGLTLAGINLARHRAPYRIMTADNLSNALSIVHADKLLYAYLSAPRTADQPELVPPAASATLKHYVDDILHYLSAMSWELGTTTASHPRVDPNHPFAPVFDAIDLIKDDLSVLYNEQQKAIKEQFKLETQLIQSRKVEALGLLAGGVAHDLNNVLSGMVTYPDLLLLDIPEDSGLREPLLRIRDSGQKAAAIVQDLLTLARRGVVNPTVLNLNTVIREYLSSPEHQVLEERHPEIQIEADLSPELSNTIGSAVHLKKTIMNLIYNAFEASHPGVSVTVRTHDRFVDGHLNGNKAVKSGQYVVVEIIDRGSGIAAEDIERIFEPFYTRKKMGRSGTGLGMAVVQGTVQDHDGYITVESTAGRGATFSLYFPATQEPVPKKDCRTHRQPVAGNGQRILVVDDRHEQLQIATAVLSRLGYRVSAADSGEAALDYLANHQVDLVVMDMVMEPGMDGLDTLIIIRQRFEALNVIIASGFAEDDRFRQALSLAGSYIKKPYTVETLGSAVQTALSRESV
jgi:signal transduction histidine kinase/ActR/RegA family two-component response regulator